MSTLRVTNIENPSTTSGGIDIDTSGHITMDGVPYPSSGPLSNRNLIINGAMTVAQRGTSGTVTTAGNYPSVDRWSCNDGGIGGFTVSQSTDAPTGFANSAKWACTSTGSATNDVFHEQKLEGQDLQLLEYGTASAKSFTVSFWVKSNKTGEYSLWIENNDANRYFTTPGYTINAANTWEFKTITVPGDTGGSGFTNDNGVSLKIRWHLVLRTSFQGTPSGAWSTSASLRGQGSHVNFADSTSNEWYITGVQVEVGDVATPFEHRSYGHELGLCQRYYYKSSEIRYLLAARRSYDSGQAVGTLSLPTTMRDTPTVTDDGNFEDSPHSGTYSGDLTWQYAAPDFINFVTANSVGAGGIIWVYGGTVFCNAEL
jgi:hypothetical protein